MNTGNRLIKECAAIAGGYKALAAVSGWSKETISACARGLSDARWQFVEDCLQAVGLDLDRGLAIISVEGYQQ